MCNTSYIGTARGQRNASSPRNRSLTMGAALALSIFSSTALSGGSADFKIDGSQVNTDEVNILASQKKSLRYNGGSSSCTDIEWYLRKDGANEWKNFDHDGSATLEAIHRAGTHELKMTDKA